jgi:hypothetical protein
MPEVPSDPENPTPTGWLYQPLESGPRAGEAVTEGGLASRRTRTVVVRDPSAFAHVHETASPPVSPEIVVGPQPVAVTPAGAAAHVTVTSDVCQSKQLAGPGEQLGSGGAGGGADAAGCARVRTASADAARMVAARRILTPCSPHAAAMLLGSPGSRRPRSARGGLGLLGRADGGWAPRRLPRAKAPRRVFAPRSDATPPAATPRRLLASSSSEGAAACGTSAAEAQLATRCLAASPGVGSYGWARPQPEAPVGA